MSASCCDKGEPIRVWALPVGDGDSIVLRLPGGLWGVVDSNNTPESLESRCPPALTLLRSEMNPCCERLGFVCLTHYHEDHYSGLLDVVRAARASDGQRGYFFHNGFEWCERYPQVGWPEIAEIRGISAELNSCRDSLQDWDAVSIGKELKLTDEVVMHFLSPTPRRRRALLSTLLNAARKRKFSSKPFNIIGIAFYLAYGQARLLFADDIETATWREIQERYEALTPCWVKVSHHGAASGNPKWLWPWLSVKMRKSQMHAVVSADGTNHPSKDVLRRIRKYASVYTTCSPSRKGNGRGRTWAMCDPTGGPHSPADTWRSAIGGRGTICHFEVYADGTVVPK